MNIFRNLFESKKVEHLITKLNDSDYDVSTASADALIKIGAAAIEPLSNVLMNSNSNEHVRWAVAGVLSEIKDVRVVEPLIAALKDSNSDVRAIAAEKLGEIKDARAIEPLITVLKDSDWYVREKVLEALGKIGGLTDEQILEMERQEQEGRDAELEILITLLSDNDSSNRCRAATRLGEMNDARAVEPLINALKDSYWAVPRDAAEALGKIKDARAVEPLIDTFKNGDTFGSEKAAIALGKINDPRAIEPLIAALKREAKALDALKNMSGLTVEQLEKVKEAEVKRYMDQFLRSGVELERNAFTSFATHGFSQLSTVHDLSKIKESGRALQDCGDAAVNPLCNFLKNYNVEGFDLTFACKEAIIVLGNLGNKKAIPAIEKFVSNHSYAEDVAQEAIKKIRSKLS